LRNPLDALILCRRLSLYKRFAASACLAPLVVGDLAVFGQLAESLKPPAAGDDGIACLGLADDEGLQEPVRGDAGGEFGQRRIR